MSDLLYHYLWFFLIYSFLGWCLEVSFQAAKQGKFVNRGFLNGPVTPIYGFGMVILTYFLLPLKNQFLLLFLASIFLTSLLEFITGFLLEKIFNDKWWDYSDLRFNIKGFVALSFSITWGFAAVFAIKLLHPAVLFLLSFLENSFGKISLILFLIYLIVDFIVTLSAILEIRQRFNLLDKMTNRLELYSEEIGLEIYKKTSVILEDVNQIIKEKHAERELEIFELKGFREKITQKKSFVHKRLEKAYPNLKKRLKYFGEDLK